MELADWRGGGQPTSTQRQLRGGMCREGEERVRGGAELKLVLLSLCVRTQKPRTWQRVDL